MIDKTTTWSRARRRHRALAGAAVALALTGATVRPIGAADAIPPGALAAPAAASGAEGEYTAITPHRFLDTRSGVGTPAGPIGPTGERAVQVTGLPGVPATNVSAVVVNITGVGPTRDTFLKVFENGRTLPDVSNLNLRAGQTAANLVTVAAGLTGHINVFNAHGEIHVVGDIVGYYATTAGNAGSRFSPSTPHRLMDTRSMWPIGKPGADAGNTVFVNPKTAGLVPAGATAAILNLTATDTEHAGFLTVTPGDADPFVSNVNYEAHDTRANLVVVRLTQDGRVAIHTSMAAHIVVDVMGWYTEERVGDRGRYVPFAAPLRLVDTRHDQHRPTPGVERYIGVNLTPAALGASLNVTAVDGDGPGYLTVAPTDVPAPSTSNVNFVGGDVVPNHVLTGVSNQPATVGGTAVNPGSFTIRAGVHATDVVVDIFGMFRSS